MTDDRWATAVHESGHAFGYYMAAIELDAVSIRPGAVHSGVTIPVIRALALRGHALNGMDPVARRQADQILVAILMGREAGDIIGPPITDGTTVRRYAPSAGGDLAPGAAARLATAEADTEPLDDDALALDLAIAIVGISTATLYVAWARAEARRLAGEYASVWYSLVDPLLREEVIGGRPVVAIFDSALERSTQNGSVQ